MARAIPETIATHMAANSEMIANEASSLAELAQIKPDHGTISPGTAVRPTDKSTTIHIRKIEVHASSRREGQEAASMLRRELRSGNFDARRGR